MIIYGMMRVKNEARWIAEVVQAMLPICERIFILDDHSTDSTASICQNLDKKIEVWQSPFEPTLDESRDKSWLLKQIMEHVPAHILNGDPESPYWVLTLDGDEVLAPGSAEKIASAIANYGMPARQLSFKLPIWYLWNDRNHRRVDGVYRNFARPSVFRIINRKFQYQTTPWGGNLHCSSIPQELLHYAKESIYDAPVLHLGYMNKEDRLRKYEWYNKIDPDNRHEDYYRHMVQGDLPEIPAEMKLLHAGPLRFEHIA